MNAHHVIMVCHERAIRCLRLFGRLIRRGRRVCCVRRGLLPLGEGYVQTANWDDMGMGGMSMIWVV